MAAKAPSPLTVVLLAAGMGTRMRSRRIKLLHDVAGRPMVRWVAETAAAVRPDRMIAVVGHQADDVRAALDGVCPEFVVQEHQLGTGHAVRVALDAARPGKRGTLVILNGDLPTLRMTTLRALLARHRRSQAVLTFLTADLDDPTGYGRVTRDDRGAVRRIVEHRDADAAVRRVREINVGIYCAEVGVLQPAVRALRADNSQGEYYLTDAVHALINRGVKVEGLRHADALEILGVNTRAELAQATRTLYLRKAAALMEAGVTIVDPDSARIDPRARIGRDTIVHPGVQIEGPCVVGADCLIYPGCRIVNCTIGDGAVIRDHSVLTDSVIGARAEIGPFAHLRPGNELAERVKIGNFVELKKSRLHAGVKANHLSYLGDADVGEGSNVGAGTITCNYDGTAKHRTVLGRGVFVGSDTQLVAPVRVGDGAYIGAGTTVTDDVPGGALAVSRTRQTNIEGWVARRRAKLAAQSAGRTKISKG